MAARSPGCLTGSRSEAAQGGVMAGVRASLTRRRATRPSECRSARRIGRSQSRTGEQSGPRGIRELPGGREGLLCMAITCMPPACMEIQRYASGRYPGSQVGWSRPLRLPMPEVSGAQWHRARGSPAYRCGGSARLSLASRLSPRRSTWATSGVNLAINGG